MYSANRENSTKKLDLSTGSPLRRSTTLLEEHVLEIKLRLHGAQHEVRTLPRESAPASLQNWARRRGTLAADENELHLGLDDTNLMLRTVQAEFNLKNMFLK